MSDSRLTRRAALRLGVAAGGMLFAPTILRAQDGGGPVPGQIYQPKVQRNVSSWHAVRWQDHFDSLKNGVIVCDTTSRTVHFWNEDDTIYKLYPSSVPLTEELTRLGYTEVVQKVVGPTWRPTPSMLERNPNLPAVVGPGPDNPLGSHALYLSWPYYRIHGTHDTRKIGRKSSSGCIGLYNSQIQELFELAKVGTQVRLI
ncbi:putative L,D-transpeptidase ErfK/SrfK precursor [Pseudoruegeria aquimaris]|uniref:Putative L,D-transpeptidase ErfK/SrfK n=1 Tax=Pseudoruegeria aquimaris TaxID=393663 RepID=A0A1Y5SQE0_9RHOB|nr:L,D-transpeptidase [Pseudoruegeria aquimaris]SLN45877.1 putative L,D-transpeptidase ErfK/SrfK precursor [Pseudoruegeria aquimaris]